MKNKITFSNGFYEPLNLPPLKEEDLIPLVVTIRKNQPKKGNKILLDRRYKGTKEFVKMGEKPWYDKYMQNLANFLGCPHDRGVMGTLSWTHYLNPIKQLRYRIDGIWYL